MSENGQSAAGESARGKPRIWSILRVFIGIGLIAAILLVVDTEAIIDILSNATPGLTLLALALFVADRLFAAVRWRMLIAGVDEAPPLGRFVSLIFSSTFVAYFLPGGIGGEILRIYGLTRGSVTLSRALASVFVERVLALLALGVLILYGLAVSPAAPPAAVLYAVILSFGAIGFATALIFSPVVRRIVGRLLAQFKLARIQRGIHKVYDSFDVFLTRPMLLVKGMIFALLFQLMRVLAVWVSALALGLDIRFDLLLHVVPIVNLVTQIPVSIGGLGVREASYVALFGLAGIASETAVALSLMTYALLVLAVTPGGLVIAKRGLT